MNTIHHTQPVKKEMAKPPMYAIVLNMNTAKADRLLVAIAVHVMVDHLGINDNDTATTVVSAARTGRAVVRTVTKEIGDTMMDACAHCASLRFTNDLSFKLNPL